MWYSTDFIKVFFTLRMSYHLTHINVILYMTMRKVQLSLHHFRETHKQHYMQNSYATFHPKQTTVKIR
jgi:hypothetical protein